MTRVLSGTLSLLLALTLLAAACGSDGGDDTASFDDTATEADATTSGAADEDAPVDPVEPEPTLDVDPAPDGSAADSATEVTDEPIPVEPDGGIGDGAGPIPGTEEAEGEDAPAGDWHGAELAETNCPGIDFQRVEAAAFSFSVPTDFLDQNAQGIDSEVGIWSTDAIEVLFDYGWYSSPVADFVGAEVSALDYSGFVGDFAVVREPAGSDRRSIVGVYFPDVETDGFQGNALSMIVQHDDPADEIIGRCIVGSIEWKVAPPS